MANFIPDEKWDEAINLLADGVSHRKVAKIVGISKVTAYNIYRSLFDAARETGEPPPQKNKGGYWEHAQKTKIV